MGSQTSLDRHGTTAVLDGLRRIVQTLRLSSVKAQRATGLSGAQLFVLQQLAEAPAQSLNDLAERTRTHQSSVSVIVTRLVGRGLVSRRRSPEDARRLLLELSPGGHALLADAPETAQGRLLEALEGLPARSLRPLGASLHLIADALGGGSPGGPPELFFEPPHGGRRSHRQKGR
ncbi:MAG TPA: MarR family transcriptional regulator [Gemmatimonadales bacterium]|nr:MarR family transcriptional regulator [Gemmatimonadales bacterium]